MDKLLDKDVHQMYKVPSFSNYLSRQNGSAGVCAGSTAPSAYPPVTGAAAAAPPMSVSPQQQHHQQHQQQQQQQDGSGMFMPELVAPQMPPAPRYMISTGDQGAVGAGGTNGGMMMRGRVGDDESDESVREDTPRSSNSTLVSNPPPHQQVT